MRPAGRGVSSTPLLAPIGGDGEVGENPAGEEEDELEAEVVATASCLAAWILWSAEEPALRPRRSPREPTAAERAAHEALHELFREWCRACVAEDVC